MRTLICASAAILTLSVSTGATSAAQVASMKAVVLNGSQVSLQDVPKPSPGAGEVLVKIRAASVHPVHWKIAEGYNPNPAATPSGPRILGSDAAGTVEAVGTGVTGWKVGEPVIVTAGGTYAEYVAVPTDRIVAKPAKLSFEEAAGIPSVATTVWNSIIDIGKLGAGQKILIHGAAGGTGSAAVQIAKARGAYVIGTASARNHAYLRSIGADEVIDYNTEKFEDRVKNVDMVLNTADLETAVRSVGVVKRGGYLLSIVGLPDPKQCQAAGITCAVRATENATSATEVTRQVLNWAAQGKYAVNIDKTWPLADFQKAWAYSKEGHTRGKIVLVN